MSTFATVLVVDSKGPILKRDPIEIEAALAQDERISLFQVDPEKQPIEVKRPTNGRLGISLYINAKSLYKAGATAFDIVEVALEQAGFNRATTVVESSVVPVIGMDTVRRPTGLRQLGYAA